MQEYKKVVCIHEGGIEIVNFYLMALVYDMKADTIRQKLYRAAKRRQWLKMQPNKMKPAVFFAMQVDDVPVSDFALIE